MNMDWFEVKINLTPPPHFFQSFSHVQLFGTPWTIQSIEFSRPEFWGGQPFPSPGNLPNPGIEPRYSTLQADSLPSELSGKSIWSGQPFPSPTDLPNPGIEPRSPILQVDLLPAEPQGKPKNTGVGSLYLLQRIFWTQESNWGLLCCRQILYQVSCQGSPLTPQMMMMCRIMS